MALAEIGRLAGGTSFGGCSLGLIEKDRFVSSPNEKLEKHNSSQCSGSMGENLQEKGQVSLGSGPEMRKLM
jgi:hypothetical protein